MIWMPHNSLDYYLAVLLIFLVIISEANTCLTPDNRPGVCQKINQCPRLWKIINNPYMTREDAQFLSASQCGQLQVCCALKDVKIQKLVTKIPFDSSLSPELLTNRLDSEYTSGLTPKSPFLPKFCGWESRRRPRRVEIVNGETTRLDEFPWLALLQYEKDGDRKFDCGGAVINERYVLTAAHCIPTTHSRDNRTLISVRLGEYDYNNVTDCIQGQGCSDPPIDFGVEEVIPHPVFREMDVHYYHDIALIRLNKKIKFTRFIRPICLLNKNQEIRLNEKLWAAGWGLTENFEYSPIKLKVELSVLPMTSCVYEQPRIESPADDPLQVCAGGGRSGKDTCKGDSGGPLMRWMLDENENLRWYATSLVSFGPFPCGVSSLPSVYTSIPAHIDWILEQLRP